MNLVMSGFEVKFLNFTDSISTESFFNTSIVNMRIKTIGNKSYINYNYYLKQPMQMIERRLNMNLAENPQLIYSLKRGSDHLLIKKYIHFPFSD